MFINIVFEFGADAKSIQKQLHMYKHTYICIPLESHAIFNSLHLSLYAIIHTYVHTYIVLNDRVFA